MCNEKLIISNANEAASAVLSQAMVAADQGTFAVGGCIVENSSGRIIQAMHNNVLKPLSTTNKVFTFDPTAHGERQLVSWYYANKEPLMLPEPEELTLVTTLDPCAMCSGALLTAGFNVAVVAIDDFAGINYNSSFSFEDLPLNLRHLAKSKFGYYACGNKDQDPSIYVRAYVGGPDVAFSNSAVNSENLMGCGDIFQASVNTVRDNSSDSGLEPSLLSNPANLPDDSPIKMSFRQIYPRAFELSVPNSRLPNTDLYNLLFDVMDSAPGAKNSVAFIDPFGNVVLCLADTFEVSPVQTAFMNVTQSYARIRYGLMNNRETYEEATETLTHPKYGTFVFLNAPNPADSTTVMMLGAYGSTMEGPVPQVFPANLQYYNRPQEGTMEELSSLIMSLPPFYTELAQLSIMQTAVSPT
jgi:tRNA(Arg) A34 adenosine deaminase TadA